MINQAVKQENKNWQLIISIATYYTISYKYYGWLYEIYVMCIVTNNKENKIKEHHLTSMLYKLKYT